MLQALISTKVQKFRSVKSLKFHIIQKQLGDGLCPSLVTSYIQLLSVACISPRLHIYNLPIRIFDPAWHSALLHSWGYSRFISTALSRRWCSAIITPPVPLSRPALQCFLYRDSPSLKCYHWSVLLFLQSAHPCALRDIYTGYFFRFPYTPNTFCSPITSRTLLIRSALSLLHVCFLIHSALQLLPYAHYASPKLRFTCSKHDPLAYRFPYTLSTLRFLFASRIFLIRSAATPSSSRLPGSSTVLSVVGCIIYPLVRFCKQYFVLIKYKILKKFV